ncbi:response regulator transcription factor [Pseudomonas sp. JL3]|uniref:response regulator transcription factor n=1 Tax=Pseudomonas sp. JL3 TaxID=2919943 RepID=UPI0021889D27|nr:response regulator transcription factor [Pseudomonas sp. JL3]MDR8367599.1 response regulator transcription factor [Pseudomonas sp. JL3]URM30558.1 response regulator transcription factor [Pseudomonas frederiksbergensis]
MKKALLVDDHPVVSAAVRIVLEPEGFKLIYEAFSVGEALSILREHAVDLVILDLVMPGGDGLDVLERIKANDLSCRVLVFSSLDPLFFQDRCMRAGAMAYVAKTNDLSQLQKAVHAVMAGYTYFAHLPSGPQDSLQSSEKQMIDKLSNRELSILQYLARGMSNKVIGELMHLSHKTISTYKTRLIEKLGVNAAVHLRDFAKRNRLI